MCPKPRLDAPLKHHPRQHHASLGPPSANRVMLVTVQHCQRPGWAGWACYALPTAPGSGPLERGLQAPGSTLTQHNYCRFLGASFGVQLGVFGSCPTLGSPTLCSRIWRPSSGRGRKTRLPILQRHPLFFDSLKQKIPDSNNFQDQLSHPSLIKMFKMTNKKKMN